MTRSASILGAMVLALGIAPLAAQNTGAVRGRVTDEASQQPLPGVTVSVGSRSVVTTSDGRYLISGVPAGVDSLRARLLGYAPHAQVVTIVAGQTVDADLVLTAQAVRLSEMVVVGYGEQKQGDQTGAISTVSSAQFNPGPIISPQNLIQDKVPGVQVVDNNEPGGGLSVRIRGQTSVSASSEPLYVIDGVPLGTGAGGGLSAGRDPLNFLNPNDIDNITVLRDASAAAIYGTNAANGVVLITTKNGRHGPSVEWSSSFSTSSVTKMPSMLSTAQFRQAVFACATANCVNGSDTSSAASVVSIGGVRGDTTSAQYRQLLNANTDWMGLITRNAMGQEHNLAVSGGSNTSNYRFSFGYLNQDGVVRGTSNERLSLGVNYGQSLFNDRLNLHTNIRGSREFDHFTPGGVLGNAAQMGPTQPVLDTTSQTGYYNWPGNKLQSADNPIEILNLASDLGTTYRSVGNTQAEWRIPWVDGLKWNVNLGYDFTYAQRQQFGPTTLHRQLVQGLQGYIVDNNQQQLNSLFETYLNYTLPRNIGPGILDLTGGYSYSHSQADYPSIQATKLQSNQIGVNALGGALQISAYPNPQESKLISFFGRVNYNISDRYLAAFTVRRDGSSRFGTNNAWAVFPSVSGAWRISEEPFIRNRFHNLSDLKLRASWATTGNQNFGNYAQYSTYQFGDAQSQYQLGPGNFVTTIRPGAYTPDIKWEETKSADFGLDYGFLNQRISGSIDWYRKNTSNLIFYVPVAAGTNLSNYATVNIGSMRNTGLELALSARIMNGGAHQLGWQADFNASHNVNELTAINPFSTAAQQILTGGIAGGVGSTIQVLEPGQPVNSFFVCRQYYQNGKPVQGQYLNAQDSVVNGCIGDRRPYHNPAPDWIFGHSSYFTYGSWDFSFTLRAYTGNYVYNNVASNLGTYSETTRGSSFNLQSSVLQTQFTQQQLLSDYYVEKASFLRADNITLGYGFNYHGQPARLYATITNAFTLTGYSGVDPTAGLNGIDNNIYPRSRTVTGGLSVRF